MLSVLALAGPAQAGEAVLSWDPPTANEDGTPLRDPVGYKVYYGTASGRFTQTLDAGTATTYTVSGLAEKTTYYFVTTAYDPQGNESTYSNQVSKTIPDATQPTLANIAAGNVTASGATITWTTSEGANTQVDYGPTNAYGSSSPLDGALATSHTVQLNGLSGGTSYHYRVKSRDAAGNIRISADHTFTTLNLPDTAAPIGSVQIGNGASSTETTSVALSLTCADSGSGCAQMQFSDNGSAWTSWETYASSKAWTLPSGNGSKTVYARFRDAAGNTSPSYSDGIALGSVSNSPPAAILDLKVRTGESTRNSLLLEWTATGGDDRTGTASRYDLRMSQSRIVEDGALPGAGEILFSEAAPVTGTPGPQAAGSPESFMVTDLETNTVYYFALKAVDGEGNASPMSNVVNGNETVPFPVTALRRGYTMISIPVIPETSDAETLLSGSIGSPVELYAWNPSGAFVRENHVTAGYGYFIRTDRDNAVLRAGGVPVEDPSRSLPMVRGWNMIGNPYSQDIPLRDTRIRNVETGEVKTLAEAVSSGWVGSALYSFNGSTYGFVHYSDAVIQLWQGYWVAVLADGLYEMVISKP
jgi:hypothetical protein